MAAEVKAAGGIPVLTTPLARRSFKGGKFYETLADWRAATIAAVRAGGYAYIDLNGEATRYITAIGQDAASKYDPTAGDTAHLNNAGAKVFGRMVADLLTQNFPEVGSFIRPDALVTAAIKAGRPV
jgi:lysophospholipase L1-like esterase